MNPPVHSRNRGGLAYWALHYQEASFHRPGLRFSDYAPALYLGISGFVALPDSPFEFLLPKLSLRYPSVRGVSALPWKSAITVIWSAWDRMSRIERHIRH